MSQGIYKQHHLYTHKVTSGSSAFVWNAHPKARVNSLTFGSLHDVSHSIMLLTWCCSIGDVSAQSSIQPKTAATGQHAAESKQQCQQRLSCLTHLPEKHSRSRASMADRQAGDRKSGCITSYACCCDVVVLECGCRPRSCSCGICRPAACALCKAPAGPGMLSPSYAYIAKTCLTLLLCRCYIAQAFVQERADVADVSAVCMFAQYHCTLYWQMHTMAALMSGS